MITRYLTTFINHEKDLNKFLVRTLHLARVRLVLSQLGSPQTGLKVIHIAGSKGKGSTAAFIAHILCESGYKVGLYTSPHLYNLRERFRILGSKLPQGRSPQDEVFNDGISKKRFSRLIKKIRPQLEAGRHHSQFGDLTYFEVLTIAAFCYFKEENVDFAVLETGLGGRLDATNVCSSLVAAITPISLEHTRQLGKTLSQIAGEKAGIIKKNSAVVLAPQGPEILKVLKARCRRVGVAPVIVGKDIKTNFISGDLAKQNFSVNGKTFKTSLLGRHQIINAAVAVGIVDALRRQGFAIKEQAVKEGIAKTFWPLRFEVLNNFEYGRGSRFAGLTLSLRHPIRTRGTHPPVGNLATEDVMSEGVLSAPREARSVRMGAPPPGHPTAAKIILDGAHNPQSCQRLAKTIRQIFPARKAVLIFGSSDDKDILGMARYLLPISRMIILTQAVHPRALVWTPELIQRSFPKQNIFLARSMATACRFALKVSDAKDLILVTGSIFLAAQARKIFSEIL